MIPRPTPLSNPERHPYVVVEVPGQGDHLMRIPSVARALKLVRQMDQNVLSSLMVLMDRPLLTTATMVAIAKDAGPEALYAIAGLVGEAWHHEGVALESELLGDFTAYGEEVFEELHEAGYTFDQVLSLGISVGFIVWDQSQIRSEVKDKALFFLGRKGVKTSPPSTPESDTSATPMASDA